MEGITTHWGRENRQKKLDRWIDMFYSLFLFFYILVLFAAVIATFTGVWANLK